MTTVIEALKIVALAIGSVFLALTAFGVVLAAKMLIEDMVFKKKDRK